jgi:hypothetical protein
MTNPDDIIPFRIQPPQRRILQLEAVEYPPGLQPEVIGVVKYVIGFMHFAFSCVSPG